MDKLYDFPKAGFSRKYYCTQRKPKRYLFYRFYNSKPWYDTAEVIKD
ncbi:MAG: hypothetical protein IPN93_04465 [Bacteroidetes bacterium]|nr:hypothetical protein [Bacteroidota bacterium]